MLWQRRFSRQQSFWTSSPTKNQVITCQDWLKGEPAEDPQNSLEKLARWFEAVEARLAAQEDDSLRELTTKFFELPEAPVLHLGR